MSQEDFESKPTVSLNSAGLARGGWESPETPGMRIAGYTLVSVLGEGGFGVVWLADQREPIVRRVAIKIIRPGMDSASVVSRFEQERQTLAMMDHPNIAQVFDAGATPTGRPYFVMEYVPGEIITEHCDKLQLSVRDRLVLMAQVCEAVQHAHGKGVIHRDLKPSNVLVEMVDGKAIPKIIDFGIAKAIQQTELEQHKFTMEGTLLGTPEYMSPEQAAGKTDIDTRTDVYSLGVLLYELLTGSPPFESRSLRVAGLAEIQRIIRDVEPPRPSARLTGVGIDSTAVAKSRRTQPGSLERQLRRELEWIPLKAMRKERERRYATAQDMASDINRYLLGEALLAGPESRVYRARKFVARHRVGVAAGAAVALAIIAGAAVSASFAVSEHRAKVAAGIAAKQAAFERDTANTVNSYLIEDVLSASDPDEDGAGVLVETVLQRATDALDRRLGDRPEIEMRVATTLGRAFVAVGRPDLALEVLKKAKALATGPGANAPEIATVLAEIDQYLGESMYRQSSPGDAVGVIRTRLGSIGATGDPLTRATLLNQLGGALKWSKPPDLEGAEGAYREALALRVAALGPKHLDVLITRHNLALLELRRAQRLPAEPAEQKRAAFEKVLQVVQGVLKETVTALGAEHSQSLAVRAEEARVLGLVGRSEEAERVYGATTDAMRRVLTTRHWRTLETLGNYSRILNTLGRTEEEVRVLEEAVEGYRFVRGPADGGTQTCAEWLAVALEKAGCAECAGRVLERLYDDLASEHEPAARTHPVLEKAVALYEKAGLGARAHLLKTKLQPK